ncbi:MAG: hypothetical protein H8E44_35210 [Planctomycetes bacterium]|nr:hypothetical protein [Planctomycetota bacterium]MBL7038803.1 hypothetical protein [Pirellulaceae bacterium]
MSIQNKRQLETTRRKLTELEQQCAALKQQPATDAHVRELTLRSLHGLMKQLKEEIARYQTRAIQPISDAGARGD